MADKVIFRDYGKYPSEIMSACHFRDEYDDLPDGAFFALAAESGMMDLLIEMSEWELKNTEIKSIVEAMEKKDGEET